MSEEVKTSLKYSDLTIVSLPDMESLITDKDPADNIQKLYALLKILIEREHQLIEQNQYLTQENNWLKEQFKLLRHQKFASSSEKQFIQEQLFDEGELPEEQEDVEREEITYTRQKPNRKDKHLETSQLRREIHYIDLSETQKRCACGQCLVKIGEDVKEEIQYQKPSVKVIEHRRLKYACRTCDTIKMPPAVELPIPKSKASASLLVEIILNKYRYHLPLYRQSKMLKSTGLEIPENTLGGWVMQSAEQLEPLTPAFWQAFTQVHVLQVDETPVKVLAPNKKGFLWAYHSYLPNNRFIVFDFNLSRSSEVVNERLKSFKGVLQTDGYSGYNTQRQRSDITSIGCWDHGRRKFADVVKVCGKNKTGKAGNVLEIIGKLYELERTLKDVSYDERRKIRQAKANPILTHLWSYIQTIHAPPASLLGKAVTYCKNQWPELIRYVDYGEAELSNCWVENQIRPFAVGRRNWLFVGNEPSAQRAALLYSQRFPPTKKFQVLSGI